MSEAAMLEAIHTICDTVVSCTLIGSGFYFLLRIFEEDISGKKED